MLEKTTLAVIIINYKSPGLTIQAVDSVLSALDGVDSRIVVVDNCSGDQSLEEIGGWVEQNNWADRVAVLASPTNSGFSGGNNFGIRAIDADYYLLLNSDTIVRSGAIGTLMDRVDQFPDVGLFSPRLEWEDGVPQESCFQFHRPASEIIRASGTGLVDRFLKQYVVALPVCDVASFSEWTSFACVLIRKEVFESVGQMDDDFFMYYEDSEFCFRAGKAGWKVMNVPEARVVHLRGGSSSVKSSAKKRKRLPKYYYESRTKYYYKCFGHIGLLYANLCWCTGRAIALAREIVGNKRPHCCEKEWLDIWTNFFNPDRKSCMYRDQNEQA